MRKVIVAAGVLAIILTLGFAGTAAAAPDNKNTFSFDVSCGEPLGDTTVVEVGRGEGDRVVFAEDGQVLVAKHISGVSNVTLSIEDGPTIPLEEDEPFDEAVPGQGFEDQLVSCDFTIEFEDTFKLDKRFVAFLELDEEFIGANATITGEATGTAEVMVPGD